MTRRGIWKVTGSFGRYGVWYSASESIQYVADTTLEAAERDCKRLNDLERVRDNGPELLEACEQARAALPDVWFAEQSGVPRELIELLDTVIATARGTNAEASDVPA